MSVLSLRSGAGRPAGALLALLAFLAAGRPAAGQERFRRNPPLPDPQRMELKLPAVERSALPNGLTVATVTRPESPLVTIQLVIRAGEADSPPDRPGLAGVTARMIGKRTRMLSPDYLENMIESMGATYAVSVFMDYTVLTMTVLCDPDKVNRALYVLRLIALEAAFSERELAAVRRATFWQLYESKKDPEVLGWRQLLGALFESHPYRIVTYNEDGIKFITTRDVARFYNRFYQPGNAAIVVSGNIDAPAVLERVAGHFAAWSGPAPARAVPPPPRPNERERILFVEAPEAVEATIFAGNVVMGSSAPDFFPFLVLKHILGGTTQSRLFMNLREAKGYATYAFSEIEVYGSCGVYWVRARVKPESIVPAEREIAGEIAALAASPAVPTEIEEAKSYLVGNLPLRFESRQGFDEWLARYVALELDPGQWDKGPEELKLVDAEHVREAARRYFGVPPAVVIVGRPEWLNLYLGDLDVVEVYDTNGQLKHTVRKGERE